MSEIVDNTIKVRGDCEWCQLGDVAGDPQDTKALVREVESEEFAILQNINQTRLNKCSIYPNKYNRIYEDNQQFGPW